MSVTFMDTFWFNAVEAEVYAGSSCFMALAFWAILKWEKVKEDPHTVHNKGDLNQIALFR